MAIAQEMEDDETIQAILRALIYYSEKYDEIGTLKMHKNNNILLNNIND